MRLSELAATMAAKSRAGGLPVLRQAVEMAWLYLVHGMGPGYYLMARFWRRELAFGDKTRHWNGRKYLRFVHRINDPAYYKVSQNKLVEKCLLARLNVPTAPLVGMVHPHKGRAVSGRPLTSVAELRAELLAAGTGRFFFKPSEGDSGRGVFALDLVPATGTFVDPIGGQAVSDADLGARLDSSPAGTIVEHRIVQHPVLARLNASSVNTLRMWVVDDRHGVRVVGAFLRVGRAGHVVDNTAAGGLACAVDVATGVITEALDLTPERNRHEAHPDSGAPLAGLQLPHWQACLDIACTALRVLPGARFSGMDVAIAADGPLVVEYNVEPAQRGATHFDLPHGVVFAGFAGPGATSP